LAAIRDLLAPLPDDERTPAIVALADVERAL
jgi:hypothetical protein